MQARQLWTLWQELLLHFTLAFTTPGWRRFVEWVTGLALNVEEHTITQSLVGVERPQDWKALETFAEVGHWNQAFLEYELVRLVDTAPGRRWYGYALAAIDDTKTHRSSAHVWGTCTFHEYTARCPNRASTVRAHNWVVLGALLHNPEQPAWFLPLAGRLYFRKSQLPYQHGRSGPREPFRTQCELAVALLQQQARARAGPHLAIFDGAFAVRSVVRPLTLPAAGQPRIAFLSRLRHDARLHRLPPTQRRARPAGTAATLSVRNCHRRVRAVVGRALGTPGRRSATGASGRSAGKRWDVCGGCWGTKCRSRRWWPRWKATASASRWSAAPPT
jgi:hypothetical protein